MSGGGLFTADINVWITFRDIGLSIKVVNKKTSIIHKPVASLQNTIEELKSYKKGNLIPNPDVTVDIEKLPQNTVKITGAKTPDVETTRRALMHVVEKDGIGEFLANETPDIIKNHDTIYFSGTSKTGKQRYMVAKTFKDRGKDIAVVVEIENDGGKNKFVTTFFADQAYLKKYKRLR